MKWTSASQANYSQPKTRTRTSTQMLRKREKTTLSSLTLVNGNREKLQIATTLRHDTTRRACATIAITGLAEPDWRPDAVTLTGATMPRACVSTATPTLIIGWNDVRRKNQKLVIILLKKIILLIKETKSRSSLSRINCQAQIYLRISLSLQKKAKKALKSQMRIAMNNSLMKGSLNISRAKMALTLFRMIKDL